MILQKLQMSLFFLLIFFITYIVPKKLNYMLMTVGPHAYDFLMKAKRTFSCWSSDQYTNSSINLLILRQKSFLSVFLSFLFSLILPF